MHRPPALGPRPARDIRRHPARATGRRAGGRRPLVPASGPAGVADAGGDPASHAELADSLSLAFLVLLESLSPEQRAAFLLRDVFDYPYDQIATIVQTSEENARQLVVRARRHVARRRPRFEPSRERRERLARRFFAAARDGDLGALEELLAHDVTLHGGLPQPVIGRVRVARTLLAAIRTATTHFGGLSLREVSVNGQPGAMVLDPSERLIGVVALDIAEGGQIQTVTSLLSPDKLRHLGPLADVGPLRPARVRQPVRRAGIAADAVRRRHGIDDEDMLHAVEQAVAPASNTTERCSIIGPDRAASLIEVDSVLRDLVTSRIT